MHYRYIAVEGNIGAGKSTLAALLAQHYNAHLVPEAFADNNFLPKFYNDAERYAFPLELSFLADRYKQLKEVAALQDRHHPIISDYMFIKCRLFAKVNLKEDEYHLFEKLFDIINPLLPMPDLLIYLHAPVPVLLQRIKQRGRPYEQKIPATYLQALEDRYLQYLKEMSIKTVIIDTSHVDFIEKKFQFNKLLDFLDKELKSNTYHLHISNV